MADTNATRLGFIRESVAGQIPASPAFQRLRYTGAPDFGQTPNTVESEEILDSGELTDTALVSVDIGGSVNIEFSHESYDDLLEAAIRGTYQAKRAEKTQPGEGLDIVDANTINISDTSGLAVGDVVYLNGYSLAANTGAFEISSISANVSIDVTLIGGAASSLAAETAPATAVVHKIGDAGATSVAASAAVGGQATLTFVGTSFLSDALEAGDYVQVDGFDPAEEANNGFYRLVTAPASDTELVVDQLPDGYTDAVAGGTPVIYFGERLNNATDRFTYTLQEVFTDITTPGPDPTRQVLQGCGVNQLTLNVESESLITGSMSFVGEAAKYATIIESGETFVESPQTTPLNSSSDVARIFEAGDSLEDVNCVQSMSVEINNNLEKRPCVGKVGGAGFRRGTFSVSGSLTTYFDDESKVAKVISQEETSLALGFTDTVNRAYLFDMPRVKLTEGGPSIPGRNDDVIAQLAYTALRSQVFGYTMKLMRFWTVA